VFRHDDISHHHESIALTSLFQNREEAVAAARSAQKRQSLIAGAGDKVQVMGAVGPMQAAWHDGSANNTLTWNPNGTLKKLVIADTLNTADAQTCNYTYDDLSRLLTDNCGSVWNQSFSYDPFGNVTKSGSAPWPSSGGYNSSNNRYSSSAFTYDANGRLTNDTFDSPIAWDIEGNIVTQSSTAFAYDGLGRTAGSVVGGVWTNYIYAPGGGLVATANNSGGIQKMFVPLPMPTAVYSGGALQQYRRNDWQGSVRVASTPSQGPFSDVAYASFGEPYSPQGTTNNQYAGLTSDISSGTEQVSLSRRYHPTEGRWISPDSIIPNVFNPQSFNSYAYVGNSPVIAIDPGGHGDSFPPDLIDSTAGAMGFRLDASASRFTIFGCGLDGFDTPCGAAIGAARSGAAFFCPFSNCSHIQITGSGQLQVWQEWPDNHFLCDPGFLCAAIDGY